jgi:hypothetical protein
LLSISCQSVTCAHTRMGAACIHVLISAHVGHIALLYCFGLILLMACLPSPSSPYHSPVWVCQYWSEHDYVSRPERRTKLQYEDW